jgi:hypothetical protein
MKKVAKGELRLVVEVTKADIMGALVRLKREVAPEMKMTFVGAHESWMVSFSFLLVAYRDEMDCADVRSHTN